MTRRAAKQHKAVNPDMKIYLIGIAGAGMHSLALYLSDAGHQISGSDPGASEQTCEFWQKRGCLVHREQKAENITGADLVIYSAAIPASNPERLAAEKMGIACSRGEALARFANAHKGSIAVCGTHGKGTTAGAILHVLKKAGTAVSDILGAVPIGCHQPSLFTPNADYLVCEVDESDKTNQYHRPQFLLINNVEEDHLNVYRDLDDIAESFASHVRACLASGTRVIIHYAGIGAPKLYACLKDCPEIDWICQEGELESPAMAISVGEPDDKGRCLLTIREATGLIYQILPAIGGRANAQNLASAACVARTIGLAPETIANALASYQGLNDRCQIQQYGQYQLVTDYASHPTCVQNDISWIRNKSNRIVVIYHPYRYSLMKCHWTALALALSAADVVLLAPMDGAGEQPIEGLNSEDLAHRISLNNPNCKAVAFPSFDALEETAQRTIQPGDSLLIFGGGSLFDLGRRIVS